MIYSMPFLLCIERIDRQFNNVFSFLSFLSSVCCLFLGCCALWAKDRQRERERKRERRVSKRPFMAPLWWSFREADNITYYNWIWHGRSLGHHSQRYDNSRSVLEWVRLNDLGTVGASISQSDLSTLSVLLYWIFQVFLWNMHFKLIWRGFVLINHLSFWFIFPLTVMPKKIPPMCNKFPLTFEILKSVPKLKANRGVAKYSREQEEPTTTNHHWRRWTLQ